MKEQEFDDILRRNVGKEIDITIVHHVEGRSLRTTGKLVHFNDYIIELELTWKEHFYSIFSKKGRYICNRKASSILSIFELER